MTMANEDRYRTLEQGVKAYSTYRKNIYHTQPECGNYPERPFEATESVIQFHEITECPYCENLKSEQ